jgi:hypothetical protein
LLIIYNNDISCARRVKILKSDKPTQRYQTALIIISLVLPAILAAGVTNEVLLISNNPENGLGIIGSSAASEDHGANPGFFDNTRGSSSSTSSTSRLSFFGNETPVYELEGNSDIVIEGAAKWDSAGYSLATGDIDGDSRLDMIIGAYDATSGPNNDRYSAGEIYVVFGATRTAYTSPIDLASKADITIYGSDENDYAGNVLTSGDINGDGKDDIIIGISNGDGPSNTDGSEDTGEMAVIFGKSRTNFGTTIDLTRDSDLMIYGISTKDFAGSALAVGNLDNDNYQDIIIAAERGDGPNGKRSGVGEIYVFYGRAKYPNSLKCSNADFTIYGNFWGDLFGSDVVSGDINNDNYADLLIGAEQAFSGPDRNRSWGGICYVIFGDTRTNLGKSRDLNNLTYADIVIEGGDAYDGLGSSVVLADLDGDNYDEIIMGAVGGDGPNNARQNAGDIYVISGKKKSEYNSTIDLQDSKNIDLVIYGADPKDEAGEAIATGDFNADKISDLIIGAKSADGKGNSYPSAGEAYIIYGNISLGMGIERDLGASGPDLLLYSINTAMHAGYAVATGDIDSDFKDDILIGAPFADKNNGSIKSTGKVFVIYGSKVLKRLKNIGLRLEGVSDKQTPVCYAEYKSYDLIVNVTDSIGISDLFSVKMVLDPKDLAIELLWTEQTNEFSKSNDPNNYVQLMSRSTDRRKISDTLVELRFQVMFSGSYPDESFNDVLVFSISDGGMKDTDTYTRIYKVENDLDYKGTLKVTSAFQGALMSGSWIQSNETITWSGLTVVYEGTTNIYPSNDYFEIAVKNDDGVQWFNRTSSGEEFVIVTIGDQKTDLSDFHTLSIIGLFPSVIVPEPIQYELKITSPNITFTNPTPESTQWFKTIDVECSITITDQSGNDILGRTIQYAISNEGPDGYGLWHDAEVTDEQVTISPKILATFEDGKDNYIKWRAKSSITTLGDIFSGSEDYRVQVDTSPIYFKDAYPEIHLWQPRLRVTCGITIADNLTGVDASTIEYAYTTTGTDDITAWISAGVFEDQSILTVEVIINFLEGTDNYIVWRANDIIENGHITSDMYKIKVSTQKPVTTLFFPVNNSELSVENPELTWAGFDPNGDLIYYDIYLGTEYDMILNLDTANLVASKHTTNTLQTVNLKVGTVYYWTVIPNDGMFTGYCESEVWSFSITLEIPPPEVTLLLPVNNSITNQSSIELVWGSDYINLINLEFQVYLDVTPVPLKLETQVKNKFKITVDNLEENIKYYWTVVPIFNNIYGTCKSGIWSFMVNYTYSQIYDISLEVNATEVTIQWNSSWEGYLELANLGNGVDMVVMNMYAGVLEPLINITLVTSTLQSLDVLNLTLNISVPENYPVRSYNIIFQASSSLSGEIETFVVIVKIEGTEEYYKGWDYYIPPDDSRPSELPQLPADVPIQLRNILLIATGLVIAIAFTILLIVRRALQRANEQAIEKLKIIIAMKRIELEAVRRAKQAAAKHPGVQQATPVPVKSHGVPAQRPTAQAIPAEEVEAKVGKAPPAGQAPMATEIKEESKNSK